MHELPLACTMRVNVDCGLGVFRYKTTIVRVVERSSIPTGNVIVFFNSDVIM